EDHRLDGEFRQIGVLRDVGPELAGRRGGAPRLVAGFRVRHLCHPRPPFFTANCWRVSGARKLPHRPGTRHRGGTPTPDFSVRRHRVSPVRGTATRRVRGSRSVTKFPTHTL